MTVALAIKKTDPVEAAVDAVIAAGRAASCRHWVPATSGNFSVRVDGSRIAITRSGVDKGALTRADVLIQELDGPLLAGSSAEAALHVRRYQYDPDIHAVFHTHGPASTVIGQAHAARRSVRIRGWELQKALAGVTTHEATVDVPVFANDQHVAALSERVARRLARPAPKGCHRAPGYLLAGHGLYAWGRSADEAARHLEALEVLFSQMLALRSYQP
ncbi:methylthioribulose 1-phosphate dehydratase [Hyphomicrobium sp.]|uniref:methylthioribulose 1-phosphate dehydratase n=1 Tax=Hyphomicrobium sp. TaxID=82 RepID=UPI0025C3CDFA|nr:methylthioribulose 1-phosphate dehydratase [Hyphomicrobium sp.]MCC7253148.1 methylthioribulose 1-phosphate dehydratase [Hyphomicrobium sp.]